MTIVITSSNVTKSPGMLLWCTKVIATLFGLLACTISYPFTGLTIGNVINLGGGGTKDSNGDKPLASGVDPLQLLYRCRPTKTLSVGVDVSLLLEVRSTELGRIY